MVGCAAVLAGCALRHEVTPPSSADAQRVWVAYWSAVERGSVAEWNRVVHSSLRTTGAEGFDPGVQADARSFLALCSVRPEPLSTVAHREPLGVAHREPVWRR